MSESEWNADVELLLSNWHRRVRESQFAHYSAADRLGSKNYWLGIPALVLSTFVGTTVFSLLEQQIDIRLKIALGMVSVAVAVLTALQTFLRLEERAEKHRAVAAKYGDIRREIEVIKAIPKASRGEAKLTLTRLKSRLADLATEAPQIPKLVWKSVQDQLEKDPASPITAGRTSE